MRCHTGRCPGTCSCTATGTSTVSPPHPSELAGVAGAILSFDFSFLLLGTCVTKLSRGTESLSWASTPSRSLPRARTKAVTTWAWASEALTSAWWASRWMWRAQVRAAFGACQVCVGRIHFLNKVVPQQGPCEITAWVFLCCIYSRRFEPVQGSDLP